MKRSGIDLALVLSSVGALAGCQAQETKSVEYYLAHRQEAQETVQRCLLEHRTEENCGNAGEAMTLAGKADAERGRAANIENTRNSVRPTYEAR
jgi:hypothetical protein